jgi:cholesterol transport system auxiliary component
MVSLIHLKNKVGAAAVLCLASVLLSGCTLFQPVKHSSISTFALDAKFETIARSAGNLTLLVSAPTSRPGFDSRRMVYIKNPHEIAYFAQNQWVDSPARMLAPLLQQALESTASYRAVVTTRSAATAELRLDTEIIRLQHEFFARPSQVHLSVRAQLIDIQGQQVLASREFDVSEAAPGDDPYGGVVATNRALKILLMQIADFCTQESKASGLRGKQE